MRENVKGKQGLATSAEPKRMRWCLSCKRKRLLWSIKKRIFTCTKCNVSIKPDKYRELTQDTGLLKSKAAYAKKVAEYSRSPYIRDILKA